MLELIKMFETFKTDNVLRRLTAEYRLLTSETQKDEFKERKEYKESYKRVLHFISMEIGDLRPNIVCVTFDDLSQEEMQTTNTDLRDLKDSGKIIGYYKLISGKGYAVFVRVNNIEFSKEKNYRAATAFLNANITINNRHFDYDYSQKKEIIEMAYDEQAYLNPIITETKSIKSVMMLDTNSWLEEVTGFEQNANMAKDFINPYERKSDLDFTHKGERTNFYIFLGLIKKELGEYSEKNSITFIRQLTLLANRFGMNKKMFVQYAVEFFETSFSSSSSDEKINTEEQLILLIEEIYYSHASEYETWNEQEAKDEINSPCFPDKLFNSLPQILREPIDKFKNKPREKDLILIGLLTAFSTMIPKVKGVYNGRYLSANIYSVINAPAASGKGILSWIRKVCEVFIQKIRLKNEQDLAQYELELEEYTKAKSAGVVCVKPITPPKKRFVISGNISSAAMINCISANKCFGLILETEADSMANSMKNKDWGNWESIVRSAAHHESVSIIRKGEPNDIEIDNPCLSILISGTPDQINRLVSSIKNGFFSRILYYDLPFSLEWKNVFDESEENLEEYFDVYSKKLETLLAPFFYDKEEDNSDVKSFSFTPMQQKRFYYWFEQKQSLLYRVYGEDIVASVRRLGNSFFRIAMILSTLRTIEENNFDPDNYFTRRTYINCRNIDFKNTEMIIDTLIYHTISIYNQVKSCNRNKFNQNNRDTLLDRLPDEFNRSTMIDIAKFLGIKEKTTEKYVASFIEQGKIQRVEHNKYIKIS